MICIALSLFEIEISFYFMNCLILAKYRFGRDMVGYYGFISHGAFVMLSSFSILYDVNIICSLYVLFFLKRIFLSFTHSSSKSCTHFSFRIMGSSIVGWTKLDTFIRFTFMVFWVIFSWNFSLKIYLLEGLWGRQQYIPLLSSVLLSKVLNIYNTK